MRDRLSPDRPGQAQFPFTPTSPQLRPTHILEPDVARLGVAALEAGRIPPLVVNWCGDDLTTIEEYCTSLALLIGREPVFEPPSRRVATAWCSTPPSATRCSAPARSAGKTACRMLVEQCYPEFFPRRRPDLADGNDPEIRLRHVSTLVPHRSTQQKGLMLEEGYPAVTSRRGQDSMKASRSALIVSAWVVGMPCGNPDRSSASRSSRVARISGRSRRMGRSDRRLRASPVAGTVIFLRSSVKMVS